MKRIYALLLIVVLGSCGADGVTELPYGSPTDQIIKQYQEEYGFEEVKLVHLEARDDLPANLIIDAINGTDIPEEREGIWKLQDNLANDIYFSLPPEQREMATEVVSQITQTDGRTFFSTSRSEIRSYRIVGDTLIPSFVR